LYKSIKKFERSVLEFQTKKFKIRIDYMGNYNYRYASWPAKNNMKNKPDLILEKGGNEIYGFRRQYKLWI
jgi:hypothetical protein